MSRRAPHFILQSRLRRRLHRHSFQPQSVHRHHQKPRPPGKRRLMGVRRKGWRSLPATIIFLLGGFDGGGKTAPIIPVISRHQKTTRREAVQHAAFRAFTRGSRRRNNGLDRGTKSKRAAALSAVASLASV